MEAVDVLIIGSGTAGSNAAKAAVQAGAKRVVMLHTPDLINTCVEAGCMPSKSILAGAHHSESLETIITTRDAHIERLRTSLTDSFKQQAFSVVIGTAQFIDNKTVRIATEDTEHTYTAKSIIIATGSMPFVPPISGLDTLGDRLYTSDAVVAKQATLTEVPKRLLTIGAGPIGLELSTFFHDLGSTVRVLELGTPLSVFDPEFGEERVRASHDGHSFPIYAPAKVTAFTRDGEGVVATIDYDGVTKEERYDAVLMAAGRRPNTAHLSLESAGVALTDRETTEHNEHMQTSVPHIFVAGDVVGHHQILHFAAAMGRVAGHNAAASLDMKTMDYDRHMLAVSFDQYPSALIGLTETEAQKRNIAVITATREFKNIGLGILKRQEYGLWKLVAEKDTGKIIGSQILGPDSAGELIQILTPIIHNKNTAAEIADMTWYHPTYAEILQSLARDITTQMH